MLRVKVLLSLWLSAILFLSGVFAYDVYQSYADKFSIGDCVEQVYETEFYRNVYYHKVTAVGNKAYLTSIKEAGDSRFFRVNNFEWKFVLNEHEKTKKINCAER